MYEQIEIIPVQVFHVKIKGKQVGDFYAHSISDGELTIVNDQGSQIVCVDSRNDLDPLRVVTTAGRFRVLKISDDLSLSKINK